MYILGIHQAHNATAAILKDGKIIAAASEERFTRKKNQFGLPYRAISYCLKFAEITPEEVDLVVFAGATWPNYLASVEESGKKQSIFYKFLIILQNIHQKLHLLLLYFEYRLSFFKGIDILFNRLTFYLMSIFFYPKIYDLLIQKFGFSKEQFLIIDHHLAHAMAALYGSPYAKFKKPLLVFTCDGGGDGLSSTISIFKNNSLNKIVETDDQNSLGAFFAAMTQYLGMRPLEDEYKLMGLAPYAPEEGVQKVYQKISHYIKFNSQKLTFENKYTPDALSLAFNHDLKFMRFDWIAGAAQKMIEDLTTVWVKTAIKKYKISTIVCGGGVFMNVKTNLKISELSEVKEMFVFPSAGDESNAIGACFYGSLLKQKALPEPIDNLYLGPSYTDLDVKEILEKNKIRKKYHYLYHQDIEEVISSILAKGEIVARFSGRMEWGARALGNRSILADASKEGVVEEINKLIKKRDFWMPFAPTILKEDEKKYLQNPKKIASPYMAIAFNSLLAAHHDLAAATHPYDKTLRPQILEEKDNPSYHLLIKKFKEKTGRGGILNTSFNIHGDPIVCSPKDALDAFERSDLKYLAIEHFLVKK